MPHLNSLEAVCYRGIDGLSGPHFPKANSIAGPVRYRALPTRTLSYVDNLRSPVSGPQRFAFLALLLAAGFFSTFAHAGPADDAGPASLAACAACHGSQLQGNRTLEAPNLSVLQVWYVERQMRLYNQGLRAPEGSPNLPGRQMQPFAAVLDEAGIVAAARLVEQVPERPSAPTIEGDAERGAALYWSCATCHGQRGEGNQGFSAPRLAGQDDWYLVRQLRNYKAGIRGARGDTSSILMRASTGVLADDTAIDDVVAYINTLSP